MKKIIYTMIACLLLSIAYLLPAVSKVWAVSQEAVVKNGTVNVRSGPDLTYPIVYKIYSGEKYPIIKENADWSQIQIKDNESGWVANSVITKSLNLNSSKTILGSGDSREVTADYLRIRKGPGVQFQIIGSVNKGTQVEVLKKNENWVKISTSFYEGWVAGEFISLTNTKNEKTHNEKRDMKNKQIASAQADSLNVRSSASTAGKVLGKLNMGDTVDVIAVHGDWVNILFQGSDGWVNKSYIHLEDQIPDNKSDTNEPSSSNGAIQGTEAIVTALSLYVRDQPSLNGKSIGTVSKNDKFIILEEQNNWAKIEFTKGKFGWVASWFLEKPPEAAPKPSDGKVTGSEINILYNGTNIREKADSNSKILLRVNEGNHFQILAIEKDWYKIKLKDGKSAYVAGWLVSVIGDAPQIEKPGAEKHLLNKVIVIDPGHGGRDNGTTGARGTFEKNLTLRTASLLFDKLKAAGARVILTRNTDTYISLRQRVSTSQYKNADAFISIHYDSSSQQNASGITEYYYHGYQEELAAQLHSSLLQYINLNDRGTRIGDYHVIRENTRPAALLELGYLSNPAEEMTITTSNYQESVSTGLYYGLARYFKNL